MSNKWLFFPSPAAATGLDLIADVASWFEMSQSGQQFLFSGAVTTQGLWPTIGDPWGGRVVPAKDRTVTNGWIGWTTSAGRAAFMAANTGAQGILITHRGHNGTLSDPAKYYLFAGTYTNCHWSGARACMVPTKRWVGEQMTGYYSSTSPSVVEVLADIDLQMAATVTSIQGTPTSAAYTGAMGTTTTGSLPTGLASVQHRGGYGLRFIFGSEAQRNTFVGNYPSGVGTWYSGVGDSLAFTKSGWAWNLSVSSSSADIQSPPSNSSNFELWHANGVYAVGDDVQIIHTA
jgi:hypothetical protein